MLQQPTFSLELSTLRPFLICISTSGIISTLYYCNGM